MRRLPFLLLLAVAATACGGSNDAKTTSTNTSTSLQAFVGAANQVCIRSDRRIFKLGRLSRDPKGWQRTASAARAAVVEMRRIVPPAGPAEAFRRMLRYGRALALTIQGVHDSLVKSDLDTAAASQFAAAQLQDKVHAAAKAAGLTFCQQPLTNWPA